MRRSDSSKNLGLIGANREIGRIGGDREPGRCFTAERRGGEPAFRRTEIANGKREIRTRADDSRAREKRSLRNRRVPSRDRPDPYLSRLDARLRKCYRGENDRKAKDPDL